MKWQGNALYENSAGVDLENSSAPLYIEVRDKNFYTFTEKIEGLGGLPLKSEGKAISLFSGGIDSPVATFMATETWEVKENAKPRGLDGISDKQIDYHFDISLSFKNLLQFL